MTDPKRAALMVELKVDEKVEKWVVELVASKADESVVKRE